MTLAPGPDEMLVLSAVLRARPTTIADLARQVPLEAVRVRAALAALAARGFLELDGETIGVLEPDGVVAAVASTALAEQRATLTDLEAIVAGLPALARDWRMGERVSEEAAAVELVHGTSNQWDLWMRLMGETPPRSPIAVFPDFAGLATIVVENADALRGAVASIGFSIRTITVPDALANPAEREQVAAFADVGVEVRTLPVVPGWFYVDAGVMAALPLKWGEAVPSSIALVREPSIVAPLAAYVESLWAASNPIPGSTQGADPVLALLAQGLSDGAIASALGVSVRTVRRRIADAAEEYGAASRFALGVEWERARNR